MNATSSIAGSIVADSWPMTPVMAGMSAVPVSHAIDLAFFFPVDHGARPDALIAETRRHLGGCLSAIETGLRVALDQQLSRRSPLSDWPEPICWPMLCAQPALLSPVLLAHMQVRAGVSLMLRQWGQGDSDQVDGQSGEQAEEQQSDSLLPRGDAAIEDAAAVLMLAEGRWVAPGGEQQPLRPDLPAEHFSELLWTAAACLAATMQRQDILPDDILLPAIEQAGRALLKQHDESASPFVAADLLVRELGESADAPELMRGALTQRRFLLFSALVGRHLRMDCAAVAELLIIGPIERVAALSRVLGGTDADYRLLLMALRPVRPSLIDAVIVEEAERYRGMAEDDAAALIEELRMAAPFRAKLAHLRRALR